MKLFVLLLPLSISKWERIKLDRWANYSPKFYTGDHEEWGRSVVNFYGDESYVLVF